MLKDYLCALQNSMMKKIYLLLTAMLSLGISFAQLSPSEDYSCVNKCSHTRLSARPEQVAYFQYGSMNKYDVTYLKLDIAAETASRFISGKALTRAKVIAPLDSFIIELRLNMVVDSVFINGVKKAFTRGGDHLFVSLAPALPAGSEVEALVYYQGTSNSNGVFAGTNASNGLNYTATLSESYQAREWFPAKQFLQDKIDSADIWVTTSAVNKVGSNGLLQGVDPLPGGKSRYRWKTIYPMSYYMPSIAVGNYLEYLNYAKPAAMAPDSILVQHYVVDNSTYFNSVKTNIDKTPPFIEKLSDLYGLYPFKNEKYGHAHASIGGGMEHQTMSTMAGFGSTLIAHELGHQWWGNNVTCARWNDIWLNEGFASYSEYLLIEKLPALFSGTLPGPYMQNIHNSVMSVATGSVFVPESSVYDEGRIFSGRLSYNKGSAIIHNLRFEMQNDNLFFQALQDFQQQYKDSVATAEDFRVVAEAAAGKSLTGFFNQWYYGEGYPTFNITYFRPNSDSLLLLVNQTTSAPGVTPFFGGLLELRITSESGDTTILINMLANNQIYRLKTARVPTGIIVDPNNWMLNQTGTITNGIVVPVSLRDVNVRKETDCSYQLNWMVEQEQQVNFYEVELSNDGIHFSSAGTIQAINNGMHRYQYAVAGNPGEQLYFRLKIVEQDGSYTYSNILTGNSACKSAAFVEVMPNPVTDYIQTRISQNSAGKVQLKLYNSKGQLVHQESFQAAPGINTHIIKNIGRFPGGVYMLQVSNKAGQSGTYKLVKK